MDKIVSILDALFLHPKIKTLLFNNVYNNFEEKINNKIKELFCLRYN